MISESIVVKASISGVKITPPPTPAITAIIAIKTLTKKDIKIRSIPLTDSWTELTFDGTKNSRKM